MIVWSYSNIDIIQGINGYGNISEGITDWRIATTSAGTFNILNSSSIIRPSGGTSEIGEIAGSTDRYMIFTAGSPTFTVPSGGIKCDILIVGGGGGGGSRHAGGGGAGAVIYLTNQILSSGIYTVQVGSGGTGATTMGQGNKGGDSSISLNSTNIYLARGGGAGHHDAGTGNSNKDGGSGGGSGGSTIGLAVSTNIPAGTYGNSGGLLISYNGGGGGGGGALTSGSNGTGSTGGNGGNGISISILGSSIAYGGGGGGGTFSGATAAGTGGIGGGGPGSIGPSTATNGTDGRGGGGGGGGFWESSNGAGGRGGSGIVIIRYSTANISIIENGNTGIGTVPINTSSLLEVGGNVNITGIFKKNNRNVINDTSNYIASTSNILVNRIVNEVIFGSNYTSRINTELNTRIDNTSNYIVETSNIIVNSLPWKPVNAGIYYNKVSPVTTTSSPQPLIITNELGTVRTMVFTYTTETGGSGTGQTLYTINVPINMTCDVLVVGGGGAGGSRSGSGGGAGALIYQKNIQLSGSYTIRVGRGGIGVVSTTTNTGANGIDSSLGSIFLAKGGGGGGGWGGLGAAGGSGGGNAGDQPSTTRSIAVTTNIPTGAYGNAGGLSISTTGIWAGSGGGGAGSRGNDGTSALCGNGGDGLAIDITGVSKFYAAGGGGSAYNSSTNFGLGGSGIGGNGNTVGIGNNGSADTGSGGGGGGGTASVNAFLGGSGGSGIVIIRFVLPAGNVGIGTTNPVSKLHVYDNTTNTTTLTIQNNYTEPLVINPSAGYALTETIENNIYYRTLTFTYSLLKKYPINPPIPGNPTNTTLLAWYRFNGDGLDYNTSAIKYNLIAGTGTAPTYSSGTTEGSFFQGLRYMNTSAGSLKNSAISLKQRALSVSVWIRNKTLAANQFFLSQCQSTATNLAVQFGHNGNCGYMLSVWNADLTAGMGTGTQTTYPGDLNVWVHLVYVIESNYTKKIYRNGVLIAFDTNTNAFSGTADLIVGATFTNIYVNADLSDLRIYTTGLSASDVATLYASYTPLLAWYRFDGDGLDYNPYATKFNLIANAGTPTYSSGTTVDSFLQGRRYINTSTGSLRNTSLSLSSRAFSVAVWQRRKNSNRALFVAQGTVFTTNTTVLLGVEGNNTYMIAFHGNDLVSAIFNDVDVWVHIVYVVLPNYNRRIYRNGVLIAIDANGSATNVSGDLRFGANYGDNTSLNIDFSDLRIYTNGLSSTEVEQLYASYSNIVTSDNYSLNFANTSRVLINGASKTVNGIYDIYAGDANYSMLPLGGQSDIPLATTTSIGTSSVIVKYAYNQNILPAIISGSGITSTIVGNTSVCSIFTYTGTPATNLNTTYTFTTTEPYLCDILIIGGGGAGGNSMGAGGGAGGVVYAINQILPASTYKVNVGRGGIGLNLTDGTGQGTVGIDQDGTESSLMNSDGSSYISLTLGGVSQQLRGLGGGGGGVYYNLSFVNGRSGGSGGGCTEANPGFGLNTPGTATQPATYWNGSAYVVGGKAGRQNTTTTQDYQAGGGGGLGDVSSDYRNGNNGVSINITGTSRFYAAGGGAGQYIGASTTAGLGGSFVGGNGRIWNGSAYATAPRDVATSGTNSTGSGGGGGAYTQAPVSVAGSGGSGVVIIRYRKLTSASFELINVGNNINDREPIIPGTTVVPIPGTLHKYILFPFTTTTSGLTGQTQYIFTTTEDINCEILVVAGGGGGGGGIGGGGGAGAVVYIPSGTLSAGSYTIRVGNGGIGGANWVTASANGYNSSISGSFGTITAEGGGGVTRGHDLGNGNIGGSGGGAAGPNSVLNYGGAAGTSSSLGGFTGFIYGNRGGNNTATRTGNITNASGGGGAGSAAADTNPNGAAGGNGGAGILINITGNNNYYGGGGGGSGYAADRGAGGIGGGGDGAREDKVGYPGAPNTGGGGGGGGWQNNFGGSGGSGVVIIKYLITKNLTTNYKIGNYNGDFKIISSVSSSVSSTQSSTFSSSDIDYMRITGNGASIYNPTGSPLWSTVSDRRIKENIEKASYDKCYDNINKLELYRFNYIKELNNINKDMKQLGYIAQEVEDIFPKAVSSQPFYNNSLSIPDLLSIDISQINYSLYGAVKKLIEIDKNKEERIKKMECLLNIDTPPTSNIDITIDIDTPSSNIAIDTYTASNMYIYTTSNNIIYDISSSNNISFYTSLESSFIIDTFISTSNNISFYTPIGSNVILNVLTSNNIIIDTNNTMSIYTSNNIINDISSSNNISFYTLKETNIIIDITESNSSNI